jgi:hypothetical protein
MFDAAGRGCIEVAVRWLAWHRLYDIDATTTRCGTK